MPDLFFCGNGAAIDFSALAFDASKHPGIDRVALPLYNLECSLFFPSPAKALPPSQWRTIHRSATTATLPATTFGKKSNTMTSPSGVFALLLHNRQQQRLIALCRKLRECDSQDRTKGGRHTPRGPGFGFYASTRPQDASNGSFPVFS